MAIGVPALWLMRLMQHHGLLVDRKSVIELGSQHFVPNINRAREAIGEFFPEISSNLISTPRDFYRDLGFTTCVSVDLDGGHGALRFDLNRPLDETYQFRETFDLVTNLGTTGRVFDQLHCFDNIHKLTRPGGIMLHGVPSQGYQDARFFDYHPSLFLALAAANDYDVLGLYYSLGEELFPYSDTVLAERGIMVTAPPALSPLGFFAVLRKTSARPFVIPCGARDFAKDRASVSVPRSDLVGHSSEQKYRFLVSSDPPPKRTPIARHRDPLVRYVVPVWGDDYIDAFLTTSLRALLESGALEAARSYSTEFLIVTDPAGAGRIAHAEITQSLSALMPVRILTTPTPPNAAAHDLMTDRFNLSLSDALAGDIYFFLTSDCFLSTEVVSRSLELLQTKSAVLVPSLRVLEESFISEIMRHSKWKFSGRELLAMALRHEHPVVHACCIDNARGINHPVQGQVLARVPGGYVGRWGVMHPIAVRISNPKKKISITVDWNYAALQASKWSDIAVFNTIDDGLVVTTTPMGFPNMPFGVGSTKKHMLECMKEWVNYPWVLEFHLAQAEQPIRLLSDPSVSEAVIAAAEQKVKEVMDGFFAYIDRRRNIPRQKNCGLDASALLWKAIHRRDTVRVFRQRMGLLKFLLIRRAKTAIKRVIRRLR